MSTKTRFLAFIASFSAANVALRVALTAGPPNVKPTTFLTIVAGIVGGPVTGLAVGALSMAVSDFFTPFGPGPWTVETSVGMAVVGLLAAWLWHKAYSFSRWKLAAGGFLLAVVFDIGTSVADSLFFHYSRVLAIIDLYLPIPSPGVIWYPFGLADELTTAILLATLGPSLIVRIRRIYRWPS